MPKLEIAVLIGPESKQFLSDLTATVERLEKLKTNQPEAKVEKVETKAKKEKTVPMEEDESFDLDGGEEDEANVTLKDVIAACRENRDQAIKVLKKLKVKSIHELKPDQYKKVLNEIGA